MFRPGFAQLMCTLTVTVKMVAQSVIYVQAELKSSLYPYQPIHQLDSHSFTLSLSYRKVTQSSPHTKNNDPAPPCTPPRLPNPNRSKQTEMRPDQSALCQVTLSKYRRKGC